MLDLEFDHLVLEKSLNISQSSKESQNKFLFKRKKFDKRDFFSI